MSDLELLTLLQNYNLTTVLAESNLNQKELLIRIRDLVSKGYQIQRRYYNGDIQFYLYKKVLSKISRQDDFIHIRLTKPDSLHKHFFRFVAIADLHFASTNEKVELLNYVYDYAIQNGINVIINLGDLIDGHMRKRTKSLNIPYEDQIEHLLTHYPFDPSIANYILYGNHDLTPLKEEGIYLPNVLESNRIDFVNVGVCKDYIKLGNDFIRLIHSQEAATCFKNYDSHLELIGHFHFFEASVKNSTLSVKVPTLSNLKLGDSHFTKGALDISLILKKDKIKDVIIRQLNVRKKVKIINEISYKL